MLHLDSLTFVILQLDICQIIDTNHTIIGIYHSPYKGAEFLSKHLMIIAYKLGLNKLCKNNYLHEY